MKGNIEFIQHHIPALRADNYIISVAQEVNIKGAVEKIPVFNKNFAVLADRFSIPSQHIYSIFPEEGVSGNFSNCLPHIVFSKKTLPWERKLSATSPEELPWLALLIFNQDDPIPSTSQKTLAELTKLPQSIFFPEFSPKYGEATTDLCNVIDLPKDLFLKVVPSIEDLKLLAHARRIEDISQKALATNQELQEDFSVIITNRLPKAGQTNVVHLVSLEGYADYLPGGKKPLPTNFARLISLKKWLFSAAIDRFSFQEVFKTKSFSTKPGALYLPPISSGTTETAKLVANAFNMGYLPLPHQTRVGDSTVSWYRGPFVPYLIPAFLPKSISSADSLVNYDPNYGMYDVSYAAPYQLGMLLALQAPSFAEALVTWKIGLRKKTWFFAKAGYQKSFEEIHKHNSNIESLRELHQNNNFSVTDEVPSLITDWLAKLKLFYGVPFYYLVPDEKLLPKESIRFFYVDPNWTDSLINGAMSLGENTSSAKVLNDLIVHAINTEVHEKHLRIRSNILNKQQSKRATKLEFKSKDKGVLTGFLLRSIAVKIWKGMEVYAFDIGNQPLHIIRMEILSPGLLLCIFAGEINKVKLSEPQEALHFGLEENVNPSPSSPWKKNLKYITAAGKTPGSKIKNSDTLVPVDSNTNVIQIATFAQAIENALKNTFKAMPNSSAFTAAEFALEMIQGVEEVTFTVPKINK